MRRHHLWFLLIAPAIGALAGLIYWSVFEQAGTFVGSLVRGACVGSLILFYERGLLLPAWRNRIRRLATPLFAGATLVTYASMIAAANMAAGLALHHGLGVMESARAAMVMTQSGFAYSIVASLVVILIFRIRDLIGPKVFSNLLLGLYHRPIREERVFLFLDIVGSTNFAERNGDLATQVWLGRIFDALAAPVRRSGGAIDDYIGDMALVTWTIGRGTHDGACLRCVFDFASVLAQDAASWEADHGALPRFRAALHCGPVVTAEIGLEPHKITYFGDVVNTTARLEALSKALDVPVIASANLIERIDRLPACLEVHDLGTHTVRGRNEALSVVAVFERSGNGEPENVKPLGE
ncbi:adenylate/guanylate cyclase domain-containing protein [Aureimonas sp. AU22]|uniref:adenylate/guanylate cyclase domain-containing protein n=1 Tax=Aureimonas sp. AU22 TaxID=1638162 RepID=UPI000A65FD55|nr:adenylate/guanylate cyclase domain-containing protein [Aureimonas sp. AU22]